jgi:hypothetical protein
MRLTVTTETMTVDIRDGVRYSPDVLDDWDQTGRPPDRGATPSSREERGVMTLVEGVEIELSDLARVALAPGDVVVLRVDTRLTHEQAASMKDALGNVWPDNRCIVLDGGAALSVVTPAGAE